VSPHQIFLHVYVLLIRIMRIIKLFIYLRAVLNSQWPIIGSARLQTAITQHRTKRRKRNLKNLFCQRAENFLCMLSSLKESVIIIIIVIAIVDFILHSYPILYTVEHLYHF
jgi:hypothetical protein